MENNLLDLITKIFNILPKSNIIILINIYFIVYISHKYCSNNIKTLIKVSLKLKNSINENNKKLEEMININSQRIKAIEDKLISKEEINEYLINKKNNL